MTLQSDPPPISAPPPYGTAVEIEPGLLWLRLALPFRLNHVNVYLVDEGDGWLVIDTGVGDARTQAAWSALLDAGSGGALGGKPIRRILATHFHPDHVGAAGFLAERTGAPLLMGEIEYLTALNFVTGSESESAAIRTALYRQNGAPPDQVAAAGGNAARYRALVPSLPARFTPLRAGDAIEAGPRQLSVMMGAGHSPAQVLLREKRSNILFAADQVMTKISPNVGIMDRSPDDDPLSLFLASLTELQTIVAEGSLILPGHHLPFRTLHRRVSELLTHHAERCDEIERACEDRGLTVGEIVPILFPFELDPHQYWFAFSEVAAHLNHLARRGRAEPRTSHGRVRWGLVGRRSHAGPGR